ncbi:MAG: transposase, partial [Tenacibaculum sp.]
MKTTFFNQINKLDWKSVIKVISKHYNTGKSVVGQPSYNGLLLFKMCLLQTWYGLSDYEVEDRINDSIPFGYFCGLNIDQVSSVHSTLSLKRGVARYRGPVAKMHTQNLLEAMCYNLRPLQNPTLF